MPNGESTRVILLEYIEGSTLAQLKDKYLSHSSPDHNRLLEESYTEWLEIAKELNKYVPALRGMSAIAERKVVHRDLKTRNIMITSTSPRQVVYIDFAYSVLRAAVGGILEMLKNGQKRVSWVGGCIRVETEFSSSLEVFFKLTRSVTLPDLDPHRVLPFVKKIHRKDKPAPPRTVQ
ncbi:hypothetical protein F5146DRAFT_1122520 [Armillaria mellea]|nr:hypothetical protein F5146DRAFT_1122520 [Armillaria mellea]